MTKHETDPAPLTVQDMPEPLGVCDNCGATPALPGNYGTKCAACMRREILEDAAADNLGNLLTPLLGAWASHWQAVGLTPEVLAESLFTLLDKWKTPARSRRPFLTLTRALLRFHRPAPYVDPGPARYTLHLSGLPKLTEVLRVSIDHSSPYPVFPVSTAEGRRVYLSAVPGVDMLTLELPDGSAALLPLGYRGVLDLERVTEHAVYIPSHLRELARGLYFASHEAIPAEPLERGEVLV